MTKRFVSVLMASTVALFAVSVMAQDQQSVRGSQLLLPFKQNLQTALRAGLDQGVIEAIAACNIRAPEIAQSLSRDDVRVGRTSHRLRNPDNVPPEWVKPFLEAYVEGTASLEAVSVSLEGDRTGYIEPIRLKPVCVSCHGVAISSEVMSKIKSLYPQDRAVGFKVGDLRGLFWVEYPTENGQASGY